MWVLPSTGMGYRRFLNMEKKYVTMVVENLDFRCKKEVWIGGNSAVDAKSPQRVNLYHAKIR